MKWEILKVVLAELGRRAILTKVKISKKNQMEQFKIRFSLLFFGICETVCLTIDWATMMVAMMVAILVTMIE